MLHGLHGGNMGMAKGDSDMATSHLLAMMNFLGQTRGRPSSSHYIVSTSIYSYSIFDLGISGAGPTSV